MHRVTVVVVMIFFISRAGKLLLSDPFNATCTGTGHICKRGTFQKRYMLYGDRFFATLGWLLGGLCGKVVVVME